MSGGACIYCGNSYSECARENICKERARNAVAALRAATQAQDSEAFAAALRDVNSPTLDPHERDLALAENPGPGKSEPTTA